MKVKRIILLAFAISALGAAGCKEKSGVMQASGPKSDTHNVAAAQEFQPVPAHGGAVGHAAAVSPHGAMNPQEMPPRPDHKGKVISTMDAAGYTYIEVEEKGKSIWVAVTQVKVKAGDEVEFPDSPPMENFHSKTLNRTFDKIIFSPAIRINGKLGDMGTHPNLK